MSWRTIAQRARQRGVDDGLQTTSADDYAAQEREAISQHDGGLPESWAVSLAVLQSSPRPEGISQRDWETQLSAVCHRVDQYANQFEANGWTFEEVFGVGDCWLRLDQRGAAWLAPGARIVEITPERIVFERGETRSTHCKQRPN